MLRYLGFELGEPLFVYLGSVEFVAAQPVELALRGLARAFGVLERRGLRREADLDARAGGIEQVYRLVGQEATADVARGEVRGGLYRVVAYQHAVRLFVARAYSAQYERRGARRGLVELDELEAAREGRVFFKVFFVFLPRRRGAGLYLAARERGLHEVRGVGASGLSARPYEHVRLVDEKDYRLFARLYLVEHALEAAFKLALDARARLEQPHVEREQRGALYRVGHVALHDAQREPFEDGGLSDARFADEYRVVFAAARQYVHHLADFRVAPENWVYLPRLRLRCEVLAEFRYEALAALRRGPRSRRARPAGAIEVSLRFAHR